MVNPYSSGYDNPLSLIRTHNDTSVLPISTNKEPLEPISNRYGSTKPMQYRPTLAHTDMDTFTHIQFFIRFGHFLTQFGYIEIKLIKSANTLPKLEE